MASPRTPFRWKHPVRDCVLLVVGSFLVVIGYLVVWAFTAEPGDEIDHAQAMRNLVASFQPGGPNDPRDPASPPGSGDAPRGADSPLPADGGPVSASPAPGNAWLVFQEAMLAYDNAMGPIPLAPVAAGQRPVPIDWHLLLDDYEEQIALLPAPDHPEYAERRALLEAQREAALAALAAMARSPLDPILQRLVDTPGGERTEYASPLVKFALPELGQSRKVSRYLAARMRTAGTTGDNATVLACFERSLAVSRVLAHQGFLIDRLVAIAIARTALDEIRRYADTGSMNADDAREALAAMDRQLAWPGMQLALEGERLLGLELIQFTHSSGGLLGGRLLYYHMQQISPGGAPDIGPISNLLGLLAPSQHQTTRALDGLFDGLISNLAVPRHERAQRGFSPDEYVASLPRTQMLISLVVPAHRTTVDLADTHETVVGGTRIRLALLIEEMETGRYPATLELLVPARLANLPRDPFAADGAFRYRPEFDTFILYSVGFDGDDNGGAAHPQLPSLPLSDEGTGFDFLFSPVSHSER